MKNKTSPEDWRKIVRNYQDSGLSISRFCREHSISASTFMYWKKKFISIPASPTRQLVKITTPFQLDERMKLSCNQVTVDFPVDLPTEKINLLITALKEI